MIGVKDREGTLLGVNSNVSGGHCEVRERWVSERRKAGRGIEVRDCEVGVREEVSDEGTYL